MPAKIWLFNGLIFSARTYKEVENPHSVPELVTRSIAPKGEIPKERGIKTLSFSQRRNLLDSNGVAIRQNSV